MKMMKRMKMRRGFASKQRAANKLIDLTIDCFDLDSSFSTEYDADYEKSTDSWRVDDDYTSYVDPFGRKEQLVDPFGRKERDIDPIRKKEQDDVDEPKQDAQQEHSSRWESFEGSGKKLIEESPVAVQRKLSVNSDSLSLRWNDYSAHADESPVPTGRRISLNDSVTKLDVPPSFVSRRRSRYSDCTIGTILDEDRPVEPEKEAEQLQQKLSEHSRSVRSNFRRPSIGDCPPAPASRQKSRTIVGDCAPTFVSRRSSRYSDFTLDSMLEVSEREDSTQFDLDDPISQDLSLSEIIALAEACDREQSC